MDISNNFSDIITSFLCRKHELFNFFDQVFLFGSTLKSNVIPNDIDLLLVYSVYNKKISNEIDFIKSSLEKDTLLPIDFTVLSMNELHEESFLSKVGMYQRIKLQ